MLVYRYKEVLYAPSFDEWELPIGKGQIVIHLLEYQVLKETPKGVWIQDSLNRRWINLSARKRFACPTKNEAIISFKARKKRQIRILKAQLKTAQRALALSENLP